jgi:hypothetical protein
MRPETCSEAAIHSGARLDRNAPGWIGLSGLPDVCGCGIQVTNRGERGGTMLEPTIQDYIKAFIELDHEAFCRQVEVPVLVFRGAEDESTFQQAATQMQYRTRPGGARRGDVDIDHQSPVIELRKPGVEGATQFGVGRSEENDLVILDETVSSRHATMFRDDTGSYMLQDLESTNGTTLNGTLLLPGRAVELRDGDVVSFGDAEYVFFTPLGLWQEIQRSVIKPIK